jgi:hypothetical protein
VPEPTNKPFLNFSRLILETIPIFCLVTTASAQGTIQFGFEEFQVLAHPAYTKGMAFVADGASSSSVLCSPFEGQKYLASYAFTSLESPDRQPIQSYTLHLLFSAPFPSGTPLYAQIGGIQSDIQQFGTWLTFEGTFGTPAQSLDIIASTGLDPGTVGYAIDAVEFVTVPEPKTFWLLTIGLVAISSRALKRPKPSRA